jgi:hypothetical protein
MQITLTIVMGVEPLSLAQSVAQDLIWQDKTWISTTFFFLQAWKLVAHNPIKRALNGGKYSKEY